MMSRELGGCAGSAQRDPIGVVVRSREVGDCAGSDQRVSPGVVS